MADWDRVDDAFLAFILGFAVQAFGGVLAGFAGMADTSLGYYVAALMAFGVFGAGAALSIWGAGYIAFRTAMWLVNRFRR